MCVCACSTQIVINPDTTSMPTKLMTLEERQQVRLARERILIEAKRKRKVESQHTMQVLQQAQAKMANAKLKIANQRQQKLAERAIVEKQMESEIQEAQHELEQEHQVQAESERQRQRQRQAPGTS